MKKCFTRIFVAVAMSVIAFSCEEELPPRQDPTKIFMPKIEGYYTVTPSANTFNVYMLIKNIYDETLDDEAILRDTPQIILSNNSSIRKAFEIYSNEKCSLVDSNGCAGGELGDPGAYYDPRRMNIGFSFVLHQG
jgi:hypothetical protein